MTPAQIDQLAREAGFDVTPTGVFHPDTGDEKPIGAYLARFATLIRASVLEEAATVCDARYAYCLEREALATAAAIRALAKQDGGDKP